VTVLLPTQQKNLHTFLVLSAYCGQTAHQQKACTQYQCHLPTVGKLLTSHQHSNIHQKPYCQSPNSHSEKPLKHGWARSFNANTFMCRKSLRRQLVQNRTRLGNASTSAAAAHAHKQQLLLLLLLCFCFS
jgi:hypothetical protein